MPAPPLRSAAGRPDFPTSSTNSDESRRVSYFTSHVVQNVYVICASSESLGAAWRNIWIRVFAMATIVVTPTKLQKIEYDVTTAEGAARVTVVTGALPFFFQATSSGPPVAQTISIKALLDPALTPGQFRRSTATASLANIFHISNAVPNNAQWIIDDAQATLDDEAGKVQLVVDVVFNVSGSTAAGAQSIMFQVTTLAKI